MLLIAAILPQYSLKKLLALAAELGMAALVEVHDEAELSVALKCDAKIIGVNSRDLRTLRCDLDQAGELIRRIPADRIVVAESGIHSISDLRSLPKNVSAVLIGTALMEAQRPEDAIQALGWKPCR